MSDDFVINSAPGGSSVSTVAGRTGDVVLSITDVANAESVTGSQTKATTAQGAAIGAALVLGGV